MRLDLRTVSRSRLAAGAAVTMVLALFFSTIIRTSLLPRELQYIPPENSLLVAGGRIDSLWTAIDTHFGRAIRAKNEDGVLFSGLTSVAAEYAEKGAPVDSLEALRGHGIDTARGFLYSVYREADDEPRYLLVVPVTDPSRFGGFLNRTSGSGGATPETIGSGPDRQSVDKFGDDVYMARPEPGLAVVANSMGLLQRSLLNRERNLAQARSNDTLFEGVRRLARGRLLRTATTFVFWQPQDVPAIRGATAAMRFGDAEVEIATDLDLVSGGVRVIDDLFDDPPPPAAWTDVLPEHSELVLAVEDAAIPRYVRFLDTFTEPGEFMRKRYGGILAELQNVTGLQRLIMATTGYREGVPDLLLGMWGDPQQIRQRVSLVRRRLQERRDGALLTGVWKGLPPDAPIGSFADLVSGGYLDPEPSAPWHRYVVTNGRIASASLTDSDFDNDVYKLRYKDWTIEYLTPRLTDNDLRYRPALQPSTNDSGAEAASSDREVYNATMKSDRYRMAFAVKEDVFWVATDVPQLEAVLDRPSTTRASLADSVLFRRLDLTKGSRKMRAYLNIDEWIHLGILDPTSGANSDIQNLLRDLQYHAGLSVDLAARRNNTQARVTMRIRRALEQ